MTAAEFRSGLHGFGLSQQQFAALWRVNPRTVRRWSNDEMEIARWVPVALDLLASCPAGVRDHFIVGRIGSEGGE